MASTTEKVGPNIPEAIDHEHDDPKANVHQIEEAQAASAAEHATTFRQAMRESWKAALWSAVISLTIVMEGYDQRFVAIPHRKPSD